jgi:hypothetical protein
LRGATPCLPGDGRAPLGAPGGDFRLRDRRLIFRQCPPESAPRLRPRPDARARPIGSAPPATAVRSALRDATPPLSPRGISGDAPRERGCGHPSIGAISSQQRARVCSQVFPCSNLKFGL